jgi:hypothetical protein
MVKLQTNTLTVKYVRNNVSTLIVVLRIDTTFSQSFLGQSLYLRGRKYGFQVFIYLKARFTIFVRHVQHPILKFSCSYLTLVPIYHVTSSPQSL